MSSTAVSDLPEIDSVADDDSLYIIDASETQDTLAASKKATVAQVRQSVAPTIRIIATEAASGAVTFPIDTEVLAVMDEDNSVNVGDIEIGTDTFTLPPGKMYKITYQPYFINLANFDISLKSKPVGGVDRDVQPWETTPSARSYWDRNYVLIKYLDLRDSTVGEEIRLASINSGTAAQTSNASGPFSVSDRYFHIEEW